MLKRKKKQTKSNCTFKTITVSYKVDDTEISCFNANFFKSFSLISSDFLNYQSEIENGDENTPCLLPLQDILGINL